MFIKEESYPTVNIKNMHSAMVPKGKDSKIHTFF